MKNDKKNQELIKKYYNNDYFVSVLNYKFYKDLFKSRLRKFRIKKFKKLYCPKKMKKYWI